LGGAIVGGAVGGSRGAAIASQGTRYPNGYYGYEGGCWLQRRDGNWIRVHLRYCY
jgi:hypothetical protein